MLKLEADYIEIETQVGTFQVIYDEDLLHLMDDAADEYDEIKQSDDIEKTLHMMDHMKNFIKDVIGEEGYDKLFEGIPQSYGLVKKTYYYILGTIVDYSQEQFKQDIELAKKFKAITGAAQKQRAQNQTKKPTKKAATVYKPNK